MTGAEKEALQLDSEGSELEEEEEDCADDVTDTGSTMEREVDGGLDLHMSCGPPFFFMKNKTYVEYISGYQTFDNLTELLYETNI